MSRNRGAQLPPATATASGDRLAVLASHLSHSRLGSPTHMAGEKEAALAAESVDGPTIFDKIIRKEIPSQVVFEDQKVLAFRDISPQAPIHIIIIPKVKDGFSRLSKAEERHVEILGSLLYAAKVVAKQQGLGDGFRIVINVGPKDVNLYTTSTFIFSGDGRWTGHLDEFLSPFPQEGFALLQFALRARLDVSKVNCDV